MPDGPQTDVYALAALLCRAITGESADAYVRSIRVKLLLPEPLHGLIDRSLNGSRDDSIRNADEFLAALDQTSKHSVKDAAAEAGRKLPGSAGRESEPLAVIDPTSSCISGIEAGDEHKGDQTGKAPDSPLPFETLGHYEIISRLGQGGMGEVYLGYERSLDRWVAIKVLPARFARDSDLVRRFRSEATAAAKLIHPNIIQIYFIGEDAGHHFFAMQHVEGMSLAKLLSKGRRLTLDESLAIIDEVLSGLVAAHRLNFVHRDIKPGNILLDDVHRRALLADFGLVKSLEESAAAHTSTGTVLGTADYIAPEQGRGQPVDCRTDIYSVGVVLYQLLCGRLPFVAHESTAVIYQHVYEAPPPISQFAPEVPRGLAAIVEKMLAKSPDDRYQTAAEALVDVRAFRAGRPVSAINATNLPPAPSTREQNLARAAPPDDTATVMIQPTTPSAIAATRMPPPARPGPDRGRRRVTVALAAAAAVPALAAGAWLVLGSPERRARWLSPFSGNAATEPGELHRYTGFGSEINCFAVTSDEELLIVGDRADKLHVWDLRMGEHRHSFRAHGGPIRRVIVSRDGRFVISCSADQTIKMWNIRTWKQVTQFNGHVETVSSIAQVPGRDEIVSSGVDCRLCRWDMARGAPISWYGLRPILQPEMPDDPDLTTLDRHISWVRDVVVPPPGDRIVSAGNDSVLLVWDLESAKVVDRLIGQCGVVMCLAATADGTRVLAGGYQKVLCLWDLSTRELIHRLPHHSATPASLAFSPDGRLALSGGADGLIHVWNIESGVELHTFEGHEGTVSSVRFLADGRRLLSGGEDRTIRMWKLPPGIAAG